tara:strand:- start:157 stop:528 length:372 start_codon:yes stop_codon:yes gene_type:complete
MNKAYDFKKTKLEVLKICKDILQDLDYEIDIYAPESFMLTTKSTRLRRVLRRFDYVIYLEVSDRIEVHISAERSIFNRGSESSVGGEGIILKQVETYMPYSLQKKIFEPINSKLLENNFEQKK